MLNFFKKDGEKDGKMNKELSGPAFIALLGIGLVIILGIGWNQVKDPPQVSPEETLRMMSEHNARQAQQGGAPRTSGANVGR